VALAGAFVDDAGRFSLAAVAERLGHERIWGLGCLAGGVRCGVAWNTLFLALLTACGTTVLGTMLALVAERGARRLRTPVHLLSVLPIITPPFVVGLGLILLFGRAGIVNQMLESVFGVTPTRWFYGLPGLWLAQLFAFTPIACLIMRGVVAGLSPSLEEAAQTLRADRWTTFRTVTLPLLKPGLANAFLVGFIESIADFGNPIVVGGQYSVLSTDVFFAIVGAQFDQGRAASLALVLSAFALGAFLLQQRAVGRVGYTTVSGKGDAGVPMRLPAGLSRAMLAIVLPWLAFTIVVYLFAFAGGFVATWGRDYTPTVRHFVTAFDLQWADAGRGRRPGLGRHRLELALHDAEARGAGRAHLRRARLLIAWLLARTNFRGQSIFEFGALLAFADSRHGARRQLRAGLQRAAVRAHRHGADHRPLLRLPQPPGRCARRGCGLQADRPLARRGVDPAPRAHRDDAAPDRPAAAQARPGGGAGLQFRALDDHRLGRDLPRDRGERTVDDLHHRPRRQRRLRRCPGLLHRCSSC
jgi:iron(III) transport system permease protein